MRADVVCDLCACVFPSRLSQAPKDVAYGLEWVLSHADTPEKEDMACEALTFKTNVLWAQLDALWGAYVEPARIPPGAWQPDEGLLERAA